MALKDIFHRTAVYFGLAEDRYDDDPDERYQAPPARAQDDATEERASRSATVRRMPQRRRNDDFDDIFADADDAPRASRGSGLRAVGGGRSGDGRVHVVSPNSFNDAQEIGTRFKDGVPVIINLQSVDNTLSVRLIDFVSGLAYALDGGMSKIADKTFLLTPQNVEVSAEERQRLVEKGFFNQS